MNSKKKKIKYTYNVKNPYLKKNMKLSEMNLKWKEDRNNILQKDIESKKRENVESYKEYGKCKRLYNKVLN